MWNGYLDDGRREKQTIVKHSCFCNSLFLWFSRHFARDRRGLVVEAMGGLEEAISKRFWRRLRLRVCDFFMFTRKPSFLIRLRQFFGFFWEFVEVRARWILTLSKVSKRGPRQWHPKGLWQFEWLESIGIVLRKPAIVVCRSLMPLSSREAHETHTGQFWPPIWSLTAYRKQV